MNKDMELAKQMLDVKAYVKVQGKDGGIALGVAGNRDTALLKQLVEAKARQGWRNCAACCCEEVQGIDEAATGH